jgi:hypothetical protein
VPRRGNRPTARTIRDSHAVLDRVMTGEVTPKCQRAQRAARIASTFPMSAADAIEQEEARLMAQQRQARRQVVYLDEPEPEPTPAMLDERDKAALLNLVFGKAAPQAEQAIEFLGTPKGQRILGTSAVTLFTLAFMD